MGVYLGSNQVDVYGGFTSGGASGASLQSKTVSPGESAQTVKADSGYDGLSSVTVNAVSKTYVGSGVTKKAAATYTPGTSNQTIAASTYLNGAITIKGDSNLTAGNIKSGVSIFGVSGSYTGSSSGGSGSISLQSKTVSPSESAQTVKPDSGYGGLSQVTVNGISSTYIGSGVTKKAATTYTPSTSNQTIAASQYLSGAQTIKGDANLVAGNIKNGVSIFGVTGSYAGASSGGSNNNNVEAYHVTSTSPSVSFKTSSGTIKIWGYGTMTSSITLGGSSTSLIAFDGDKYYKGAVYGTPTSTSLSLSVSSNGAISGLPSGLTALDAIITRGI